MAPAPVMGDKRVSPSYAGIGAWIPAKAKNKDAARPALLTSFILSFTWTWGDYLAPALLLDIDHTTLAVAITQSYRGPHGNYIPTIQAAAAALYVLPVLLIFLFAQRYFVRSIVTSGVKG